MKIANNNTSSCLLLNVVVVIEVVLVCVLVTTCNATKTPLTLSNTLGNNMVLQRAPRQATIWGWATPSDTISVTTKTTTTTKTITTITTADNTTGTWRVRLPPTAAGGPYSIIITSEESGSASLENVMFGEVWMCGGQSNMQLSMRAMLNGAVDVEEASNYTNIRLFTATWDWAHHPTPLTELTSPSLLLPWSLPSATTLSSDIWDHFSAVCWYYGKSLADQYPDVPIGLIENCYGGTAIQAWMDPISIDSCTTNHKREEYTYYSKADMSQYLKTPFNNNHHNKKRDDNDDVVVANTPSNLWNSMMSPFIHMTIGGMIWYQGESNVGEAKIYSCLLRKMITVYREKFGDNYEFPFLVVQLGPWDDVADTYVPELRAAQVAAIKGVANTWYVTAADLGDADTTNPYAIIHPRNKLPIGKRLANVAVANLYGKTSVLWQDPQIDIINVTASSSIVTYHISFTPSSIIGGLYLKDNVTCPKFQCICEGFMIRMTNYYWYPATSVSLINSNTIIQVSLTGFDPRLTPVGIRYAYSSWPIMTVFSTKSGLPLAPFVYHR